VYSTVIASLADEPLLIEALDSVFEQTVPPSSVEVVIDRKSGATQDWIRDIHARHPSVTFVVQQSTGMAAALGEGISRARAEFVSFLDSDDLWLPRKQEHQLARLRDDPDLDAVSCLSRNTGRITGGERPAVAAAMFTATTFRTTTFERFGLPDVEASHYVWLYRWWSCARGLGIRTSSVDYVGLERRIHGGNSWIQGQKQAHRDLMAELRRLSAEKRQGHA
jgi:glycosyltransferase involved in cell wall biosynthesis